MKILIADKVHDCLLDGLKDLAHEVDYFPEIDRKGILETIYHYEGLVIRSKTNIDNEIISKAVKLKFIARAGAGTDNIDIFACEEQNITCLHAAGANADAVGEQALGMLLALLANITKADKEVRNGIWDREGNSGFELNGKTIGIIGYGYTGKAFARKLSGMDVEVLAYDKYLKDYSDTFATQSDLDSIYKKANIISFHVPLTSETQYFLNNSFIQKMNSPFCLLNLSRGQVVNTSDLLLGLETKKIKGACLDVLENEKIDQLSASERAVFNKLTKLNEVVLTPHIGGWSKESFEKISKLLLQKIKELTKT
jgi:D-3-phosphoglycerate dehydrogenase